MDRIISDRYAEALFSLAVENNAIDRYEEQVKLVLDVISGDKEIIEILTHLILTVRINECFNTGF